MKELIKKILPHLAYFYKYLSYRIFILLILSILCGLMDGLGLAMFIPLLELVAENKNISDNAQLGNLTFILDGIRQLGFEMNLAVVLCSMWFFFILKGISNWALTYFTAVYSQFFVRTIRDDSIISLSQYDYKAFINADAGKIQNTLSGEVSRVSKAFLSYNLIMQHFVLVITYSLMAFLTNPEFALLVIAGGLLTNLLFSSLFIKTKRLSNDLVLKNHNFQGLLIQFVAFFKYLRATATLIKIRQKLLDEVQSIEEANKNIGTINALISGIREPLMIGIIILTILIQVNIMGGVLSTIIISLLFFYRGLTSVSVLQSAYNNFSGFFWFFG